MSSPECFARDGQIVILQKKREENLRTTQQNILVECYSITLIITSVMVMCDYKGGISLKMCTLL